MGVITPFRTAGCGGGLQLCWFLLFTGHLCPSDLARGPLSHRLRSTPPPQTIPHAEADGGGS